MPDGEKFRKNDENRYFEHNFFGRSPKMIYGQGGNRTPDAQIFSLPLYRLSYLAYSFGPASRILT